MNPRLQNPFVRLCQRLAGIALLLGLAQPALAGFTDNGNGTVTDSTTSLVWDQCPYGLTGAACDSGTVTTWVGALNAAAAANTASYKGFTDWRVPNKNELESLVNINTNNPAWDSAFPSVAYGNYYWTSTSYTPNPSSAWVVGFGKGHTYASGKGGPGFVRLVRSGQSFASFDAFPPLPGVPTGVTGTAGNTQAAVSWTAPSSGGTPTGYNVQVATSSGGTYANASGRCAPASTNASTATSCTATGLANDTTYYFQVAAINSSGTGSTSSASAGVTPYNPISPQTVSFNLADGETRQLLGLAQVQLGRGSTLVLDGAGAGSTLSLPAVGSTANLLVGGQTLVLGASGAGTTSTVLSVVTASVNGQTVALPRLQSGCLDLSAPAEASALLVGSGASANVVSAGPEGLQLHACVNAATRATETLTTRGAQVLACPAAGRCAADQSQLALWPGEVADFAADGRVSELRLGNASDNTGTQVGDALRTTGVLPASLVLDKAPANLQGTAPQRLGTRTLAVVLASALQAAHPEWGDWVSTQAHPLGGYTLEFTRGRATFMAQLPVRLNLSLADGVRTLPDGTVQVVAQGLVLQLRAVLHQITAFGQALQALQPPLSLMVRDDGSLLLPLPGTLMLAQPELFSPSAALALAGTPVSRVESDSAGVLRHVTVQGAQVRAQALYPTAFSHAVLLAALQRIDAQSTLLTQTNGTLLATVNGVGYVLRPHYLVSPGSTFAQGMPVDPVPDLVVQGGKLFVNDPAGVTQGFEIGAP